LQNKSLPTSQRNSATPARSQPPPSKPPSTADSTRPPKDVEYDSQGRVDAAHTPLPDEQSVSGHEHLLHASSLILVCSPLSLTGSTQPSTASVENTPLQGSSVSCASPPSTPSTAQPAASTPSLFHPARLHHLRSLFKTRIVTNASSGCGCPASNASTVLQNCTRPCPTTRRPNSRCISPTGNTGLQCVRGSKGDGVVGTLRPDDDPFRGSNGFYVRIRNSRKRRGRSVARKDRISKNDRCERKSGFLMLVGSKQALVRRRRQFGRLL